MWVPADGALQHTCPPGAHCGFDKFDTWGLAVTVALMLLSGPTVFFIGWLYDRKRSRRG